MSTIKYRLILDRKEPIYFKGELIKGVVELETEFNLRKYWMQTHVVLLGTCLNKWQLLPKKWQLKRKTKLYTYEENFYTNHCWCDNQARLKKQANPDEAVARNETNQHSERYKFQFQLIEQLPTSCITRDGHIQYKIKFHMTLHKRGSYASKPIIFEQDQLITIIRTLNPNGVHLYEKAWLIELKPLLKCRLNQPCFVPGQSIHFILTLANQHLLWFIQGIIIELQEIRVHMGGNNKYKCHKQLQTRHTLDRRYFGNIKYSQELFKKQEKLQYFDGILKIPSTTVPSSNYPIYPHYTVGLGIFHGIKITVKPRHKWMHLFHSDGHVKLITIGTQPMMKSKGVELLKRKDEISMSNNNFKCLERADHRPMMQAYIPKYSLKEMVSDTINIEQEFEQL